VTSVYHFFFLSTCTSLKITGIYFTLLNVFEFINRKSTDSSSVLINAVKSIIEGASRSAAVDQFPFIVDKTRIVGKSDNCRDISNSCTIAINYVRTITNRLLSGLTALVLLARGFHNFVYLRPRPELSTGSSARLYVNN